MRVSARLFILAAVTSQSSGSDTNLVGRQSPPGSYVEACPNPNYQGLSPEIPCLNFTNPTILQGYGQRICTSLTDTPLRVGSPQGISSVRMFPSGVMNCTLYKSEDCLPDNPANGFVIPAGGSESLPDGVDDTTVAFKCEPLVGSSNSTSTKALLPTFMTR
ncbi:hypothetical protein JX266_013687 [Neoarthrinium moseri]|nr:hypothetical protein JX266_013687 [Neoarthrinium moseri]